MWDPPGASSLDPGGALPIAGHHSPALPLPSKPRSGAQRPSQCLPLVGPPGSLESKAEVELMESCPLYNSIAKMQFSEVV